jgi:hypothetical protein
MSIPLDEVIAYYEGELSAERESAVEEALFEDETTARRLDAVVRLDEQLRRIVAAGRLQSLLTVRAVEGLERSGLAIRTYAVGPGEEVQCTVADEDFVVIRLRGDFEGASRVDVVMDGTFEGMPPAQERYEDVPVDHAASEIVLVYPGDRIRALPESRFRYTLTGDDRPLGEYQLHHTPP